MKKLIAFALIAIITVAAEVQAQAPSQEKIKMYFNNEEITKVIDIYAKATGQKFIVDASVRGKISILVNEPVTADEAFSQLSTGLALNGFAISKQGDTMVVANARSLQRSFIPVSTDRPTLKPERMYMWVYSAKHVSAEQVMRELRMLSSSYGEMSVLSSKNQIIFTDWASNLNRVADLMAEIDKPVDPAVKKIVDEQMKERNKRREMRAEKSVTPAGATEEGPKKMKEQNN